MRITSKKKLYKEKVRQQIKGGKFNDHSGRWEDFRKGSQQAEPSMQCGKGGGHHKPSVRNMADFDLRKAYLRCNKHGSMDPKNRGKVYLGLRGLAYKDALAKRQVKPVESEQELVTE